MADTSDDERSAQRASALACLALALLWCVPALVVGFRGDFPLNDDWAFVRTAETLARTGRFERVPWMYALGYTHVAAGAAALALSPLASSYETLRILDWLAGLAATLGVFALARRLGAGALAAFLAAATLAANPLFLNLSFTFMSDVGFVALCTWSLFCWAAPPERRRAGRALAVGLACAALLSRQPGAALLLAFAGAALLPLLRTPRRLAGASLALAATGAIAWWTLRPSGAMRPLPPFGPADFAHYLLGPSAAYFLLRHAGIAFVYLGLFLAPLAWLVRPASRTDARRAAGTAALLAGAGGAALAALGRHMPLGLNLLHEAGVGPISLPGRELLAPLPPAFWWSVTALGLASGAWLTSCGLAWAWRARAAALALDPARAAIALFALLYFGGVAVRSPCFDRYWLAPLAPLAALAASHARAGALRRAAAAATLAAFGVFGTLAASDYLALNRARWSLLAPLVASGVAPERIDGGFEFGGRYLFGPKRRWRVDDEWVVSLEQGRVGYRADAAPTLRRWLPPSEATLRLLHREARREP